MLTSAGSPASDVANGSRRAVRALDRHLQETVGGLRFGRERERLSLDHLDVERCRRRNRDGLAVEESPRGRRVRAMR